MRRSSLCAAVLAALVLLVFAQPAAIVHKAILTRASSPLPRMVFAVTCPGRSVNGHPVNCEGYVLDGSPQLDDAHCVGTVAQRFACLLARHPDLPAFIEAHSVYVSPIPRNAVEACIIGRESGGRWDPEPPGDGGQRYQIMYGTWVANGGAPGDWGHAPPAEQDAVFMAIVSSDGYGPWTAYDGC